MTTHLRPLLLLPLLTPLAVQARPPAGPAPSPATITANATHVYLTGDYGLASDTDVLAGIFSLERDAPRWRARAEVSVLTIDGPSTVGAGGSSSGARPTGNRTTGLGDTNLEASWKLLPADARRAANLTGRVKLPTADEDHGLGTGKIDYFAQLDLRQNIGDIILFGNIGWQFLGDSARYRLKDGPYATIGLAGPLNADVTAGVGLNWRSDTGGGADDAMESFFFVSREIDADWRATVIGIVGFTDASPDLGAGLSIAYTF